MDNNHRIVHISISNNINEPYQAYLHRVVSKDSYCGTYGVWMTVTAKEQQERDIIMLYTFLLKDPFPFVFFVPVEEPEAWWIESLQK